MRPRVLLATLIAAVLAGCGQASAPLRTADPGAGAGAAASAREHADTAEELFMRVDRALAAETSVREDMGNLNPPPTTTLLQEYGAGRDAVVFTVDLRHGTNPIRFYRSGGLVYAEGEAPIPMSDVDRDDTAVLAQVLHSDVRQDFERIAAHVASLDVVGEETVKGVDAVHYRLLLRLAPDSNPLVVPTIARGLKPADLWVATDGLPVRLEVAYAEPINGIPGTGAARVDYSGWSEPLDIDVGDLDWS